MEVEHQPQNLSPYLQYFDTAANFAWREPRPQEIERRRVLMHDLLIYDILLRSGGIRSPDILYPPRDAASLVQLLDAIDNSNYDVLKKDCLVYFLLKWHQDGREDKFQDHRCIPPQFSALADAYWHLDSGINIARGIAILADARLNRDYASKILQAISLSPDAFPLIRKYVRTARPALIEPDDLELYTLALVDSSLLEAWQYQRTFNETNEIRPRLLKNILEWCISPKPRPTALMQLLSLPFSPFEESILHSYVLNSPNNIPADALPVLQDLVCVRLVQLGRYADAIRMDRRFSASKVGSHSRQTQERSQMVQDIYEALPPVQRAFIDGELSEPLTLQNKEKSGEDDVLTKSWEEIQPPDLQTSSKPQPTIRPISERSNAPRFGGPSPAAATKASVPSAPGPQIPTIFGSPTANRHAPRPGIPLSSLPATPSGSRPRQSLSNTTNRLALGIAPHVSSPLSGAKFPFTGMTQPPMLPQGFPSASRQQNAFYTPPVKANGHGLSTAAIPEPPKPYDEKVKAPVPAEEEQESEVPVDDDKVEHQPTEEPQELGFSVFGNGLSHWTNIEENMPETISTSESLREKPVSRGSKRKVPGGFASDEDEDMDEGNAISSAQAVRKQQDEDEAPMARSTRSKLSARVPTRTKKPRSTKSAAPERRSPGPSFPGALMDEDGLEDEEVDHVAPLRAISPKKAMTSGRRTRASSASDITDELSEGVQTRRRSSRLSTTASAGNVASPETSPKRTSAKQRKSAKAPLKKKRT